MNKPYKIGICSIGYECAEHLDKVMKSWSQIKKENLLKDYISDLYFSAVHGCFQETFKLNFPIKSQDNTIEKLIQYKKSNIIDNFILWDKPREEFELWTDNLFFLFSKNIDLLWMVNLQDEIWEIEEIKAAIEFINNNQFIDIYRINFANYVFDYNTIQTDFRVPRLWWVNRNGGIQSFWRDDLILYVNQKRDGDVSTVLIPSNIIMPKHYSWVGSKQYLLRKLAFQKLRYSISSYRWNDEKDCLEINPEYYKLTSKPFPEFIKIK
ncbi:MAG: hypothetical protein AABY22_26085 [Nanoarchaeota archaeon]